MLIKKYIRTKEGFVLFPDNYCHAEIAGDRDIVSAGFIVACNGEMYCTGESLSLGIESMPEDTELLKEWLS